MLWLCKTMANIISVCSGALGNWPLQPLLGAVQTRPRLKPVHAGSWPVHARRVPLPAVGATQHNLICFCLGLCNWGHFCFLLTSWGSRWSRSWNLWCCNHSLPCALFMLSTWCRANLASIHHPSSQPALHAMFELSGPLPQNRLVDLSGSPSYTHMGLHGWDQSVF